MINEIVVRIIAERIITRGENPLRKRPFQLDDVTNEEYRKAVEDYIITNTADVTGVEEVVTQ
ncbi:hypothetical protein B2H94_10845 [Clostridium sporogenes]|uniref:Phage protein n=1 Tax=Clostridium sporogenes TaxID=1509 RepID=A0ABD6RYJ9_CLOSG|nr:hypothetical protein [Clostridium sporogenes]NFG96037.1 hypothetical protein [Clostridium sporogenes]OSB16683.1 hypothetical protein B2H94_10845 [Clostridium sporogenes]